MSRRIAIIGKFTHEGIVTALKARDLEFQQKMLLLSQKMDLEALSFSEERLASGVSGDHPSILLDLSGNTGSISLGMDIVAAAGNSQASKQIGNVFNSGLVYTDLDEQILQMIAKYSERVAAFQLRSDLDLAKTKDIPESERKIARGRISSFLFSIASKVGKEVAEVSVDKFIEYMMSGVSMC